MNSVTPENAIAIVPHRTVANRIRSRQTATVALLFTGYAAYYFCRTDLSVAMPLLIEDLNRHGMSHSAAMIHLGQLASLGVLAYALGKFFLAGLSDLWGGRRSFILGLGGAIAFTLLFASGSTLPLFTFAWIGNRLIQSIGWGGLVKICSKWFGYSSYGTVMGMLSLSFLVGDAAARQSMGMLIHLGHGWRALFYFAAAVAGLFLAINLLFLRESRTECGYPSPELNPLNLFAGATVKPNSFWELFKPLLFSRAFGIVCALSLGCTIVRESFNLWTAVYLRDYFGYSASAAAAKSAIFPTVGVVSVLFTGWISDRLGASGRSLVMFLGLSATVAALLALTTLHNGPTTSLLPVLLVGVVAFGLLGPYSCLAGAFALDFGGGQAGAASSGLIDGVGYLGGVAAGDTVARLSVAFGWRGVFGTLAAITALSALAAGYLNFHQRRLQRVKG
ncbi:MAG TPA: MFS transporter [Candidatus Eremiobacteraceae bacterium]|nr:MFS transporter [Candidatus Eremiobacteraceae bacterium]